MEIAGRIGYPVLVRPSFVLGGRAMMIVYNDDELKTYMQNAVDVSPERPVLVDRFLEDAIEVMWIVFPMARPQWSAPSWST